MVAVCMTTYVFCTFWSRLVHIYGYIIPSRNESFVKAQQICPAIYRRFQASRHDEECATVSGRTVLARVCVGDYMYCKVQGSRPKWNETIYGGGLHVKCVAMALNAVGKCIGSSWDNKRVLNLSFANIDSTQINLLVTLDRLSLC
jgi:uncharacterized protein (DUF983 family)